jgi:lipopolysaccharide/colanic/teichoic acid biosynthesis glycosyltransferase
MSPHKFPEDARAFPYRPAEPQLVRRFEHIFKYTYRFPERRLKRLFDVIASALVLALTAPFWLAVGIAIWVDGLVHPAHGGPVLDPYIACSGGKKFLKLKFRTVKTTSSSPSQRRLDYRYRPTEHAQENLTCVGWVLKACYLDELPQILNVLRGEMTIVGPRALAWHHYVSIVRLGHPLRRMMSAGLIGPAHVQKGTPDFPDLTLEYTYANSYLSLTAVALLLEDTKLVLRGIAAVFERRGL